MQEASHQAQRAKKSRISAEKEAYMEAKVALQELNLSSDEETESHTNLFDNTETVPTHLTQLIISQMMQTPTPLDS